MMPSAARTGAPGCCRHTGPRPRSLQETGNGPSPGFGMFWCFLGQIAYPTSTAGLSFPHNPKASREPVHLANGDPASRTLYLVDQVTDQAQRRSVCNSAGTFCVSTCALVILAQRCNKNAQGGHMARRLQRTIDVPSPSTGGTTSSSVAAAATAAGLPSADYMVDAGVPIFDELLSERGDPRA